MWEAVAPVAEIISVYVPEGVDELVMNVKMEIDESPGESWSGLMENATEDPAADAGTRAENATLPERPMLERVSVEPAEPPAPKMEGVGAEAAIEKSGCTVNCTIVVSTCEPLVAITVSV